MRCSGWLPVARSKPTAGASAAGQTELERGVRARRTARVERHEGAYAREKGER